MNPQDHRPSAEDAVYASTLAFLRRNAVTIALLAPIVVVSLLSDIVGGAAVLIVVIIYLFEAMAYAVLQRQRGVRPADPATALRSVGWWIRRLIVAFGVAIVTVVVARIIGSIGS